MLTVTCFLFAKGNLKSRCVCVKCVFAPTSALTLIRASLSIPLHRACRSRRHHHVPSRVETVAACTLHITITRGDHTLFVRNLDPLSPCHPFSLTHSLPESSCCLSECVRVIYLRHWNPPPVLLPAPSSATSRRLAVVIVEREQATSCLASQTTTTTVKRIKDEIGSISRSSVNRRPSSSVRREYHSWIGIVT